MSRSREPGVPEFSRITTALFSAAIGHSRWERFLDELASCSGGVRTHIIGFDEQANLAIDMAASGYDPAHLATYREHYNMLNAWAPGFMEKPVGTVVDCEDMCATEDLLKTEFYHDWLRPQEDIIQGGGALILRDASRIFALGGNLRARDAEKLKSPWLGLVGQMIPHLRQAFEVSRALAGARLEAMVLQREGLREIPGILILEEGGRVVFANDVASAMLDIGDPISIDSLGRFSCAGRADIIREYVQFQLASLSEASFEVDLKDAAGWPSHHLRMLRFNATEELPLPIDAALAGHGACLLAIVAPVKRDQGLAARLGASLGLTPTEAEVARLVAEGMSSRDIAERRGVSLNTVRNQVQTAMSKAGTRRRAELARLVWDIRSRE
jgi:DNA-binding CsgD family transcriptional regulator